MPAHSPHTLHTHSPAPIRNTSNSTTHHSTLQPLPHSTHSVVAINIQYLTTATKLLQVQQFLHTHTPAILALTETWSPDPLLSASKYDYVQYNLSNHPPHMPTSAYPSTQTLLVRKSLPHNILPTLCHVTPHLSLHWVRIRTGVGRTAEYTLVCSVYRSPNGPAADWTVITTNVQSAIAQHPTAHILLIGDFNSRLQECGDTVGASTTHPIYSALLHPYSLAILNSQLAYGQHTHTFSSTHSRTGAGTSITDLALCSQSLLMHCESMAILDQSVFHSDHLAIQLTLSPSTPLAVSQATAPHYRFRMDKLDTALFQSTMDTCAHSAALDFSHQLQLGTQQSMDAALAHIHHCYSTATAAGCPKTMVRPGLKPWWNLIENRAALYKDYQTARATVLRKRNPHCVPATPAQLARYYSAKDAWECAIRAAKDKVFNTFVAQLDANPAPHTAKPTQSTAHSHSPPTPTTPAIPTVPQLDESDYIQAQAVETQPVSLTSLKRRLWWSFYKRTKPSEFGAAMVSDHSGDLPADMQASLNNMSAAFASISQSKPDSTAHHSFITAAVRALTARQQRMAPTTAPFTQSQLDFIFDKIPKSAAGSDDIHVEFMHVTPQSVRTMIYTLYQRIWHTGILPTAFTQAKVVPLYKGDGSRADTSNYRPISITSLLIRTLERLLRPHYNSLILPHISQYQAGFRPGYCTQDNIHRAVDYIYRVLREGKHSAMLSIDLSKAFDTVWVDGLLYILHSRYGLRGSEWLFIKAFLTNRSMFVVGQNMQSILQSLTAGVPQGSVLAPLLFLAYIDMLAEVLSPHGTCALYADDALAWPTQYNADAGILLAMIMADAAHAWAVKWKMTINLKKSAILQIAHPVRHRKLHWPILLWPDGTPIPYARSMRVLGITVQGDGRWAGTGSSTDCTGE